MGGLARTLRQRLEEERKKTEEAEAELDRQRASNAGLGASVSRLEGQLAAKKAFWEVGALDVPSAGLYCATSMSPPPVSHSSKLELFTTGAEAAADTVRINVSLCCLGLATWQRCRLCDRRCYTVISCPRSSRSVTPLR